MCALDPHAGRTFTGKAYVRPRTGPQEGIPGVSVQHHGGLRVLRKYTASATAAFEPKTPKSDRKRFTAHSIAIPRAFAERSRADLGKDDMRVDKALNADVRRN